MQSDISAETFRDDLTSVRNPILASPHALLVQSDVSAPPDSFERDEDVFGYNTLSNFEQPKESDKSQMQDEEEAAHSSSSTSQCSLMPSLPVQQQSASYSTSQQLINEHQSASSSTSPPLINELLEAARAENE